MGQVVTELIIETDDIPASREISDLAAELDGSVAMFVAVNGVAQAFLKSSAHKED